MPDERPKLQSIFPDLPRERPAIDKDGNFSALWDLGLSALFQALQQNFKNEGIMIPPLTQDDMNTIQSLYQSYVGGTYNDLNRALPDISGQTVYDRTTSITNQFVIATDGSSTPVVTLAKWVPLSVMLTYAGNPNTHVSGVLNWMCFDTIGHLLYICTTAGNSSSAVWTGV